MPETITIKNPKKTNTIHLLEIIKIIEEMNTNLLVLADEVAYIRKWIKAHEDDELKLKKSGWFY